MFSRSSQVWWFTPINLATGEVEIRRINKDPKVPQNSVVYVPLEEA
jgi:hypothetical protein